MIKFTSLLGLTILLTVPALADPATAIKLRDEALADPTAYEILESLTSEIGPRPAGSPAAIRARDWAVAKMKSLGFTNVHVEPFAKRAWLRDAESADVIAPVPQKLAILGLGNSVPTPAGGITAEVVVLKSLAELKTAPADAFTGKIVLVNQPMTRTQDESGYSSAVAARGASSEASRRGAVAYLSPVPSPPARRGRRIRVGLAMPPTRPKSRRARWACPMPDRAPGRARSRPHPSAAAITCGRYHGLDDFRRCGGQQDPRPGGRGRRPYRQLGSGHGRHQ